MTTILGYLALGLACFAGLYLLVAIARPERF